MAEASKRTRRNVGAAARAELQYQQALEASLALHGGQPVLTVEEKALQLYPIVTREMMQEIFPSASARELRYLITSQNKDHAAKRAEYLNEHKPKPPLEQDDFDDVGLGGPSPPAPTAAAAAAAAPAVDDHLKQLLEDEKEFREVVLAPFPGQLLTTPSVVFEQDELQNMMADLPPGESWKFNSTRHVSFSETIAAFQDQLQHIRSIRANTALTIHKRMAEERAYFRGVVAPAARLYWERVRSLTELRGEAFTSRSPDEAFVVMREQLMEVLSSRRLAFAGVRMAYQICERWALENFKKYTTARLSEAEIARRARLFASEFSGVVYDTPESDRFLEAMKRLGIRRIESAEAVYRDFLQGFYLMKRDGTLSTHTLAVGLERDGTEDMGRGAAAAPDAVVVQLMDGFSRTKTSGNGVFAEYGGCYFYANTDVQALDSDRLATILDDLWQSRDDIMTAINANRSEDQKIGITDFLQRLMDTVVATRVLYDSELLFRMMDFIKQEELPGAGAAAAGSGRAIKICPEVTVRVVKADGSVDTVRESVIVGTTVSVWQGMTEAQLRHQAGTLLARLTMMIMERNYEGSGVNIHSISSIRFSVGKIRTGVRGGVWFELPEKLAARKCVRNIHSDDERCAQYAIALSMFLDAHAGGVPTGWDLHTCPEYAPLINSVDWSGISFPTMPCEFTRFERLNPEYGVFVYEWDNDEQRAVVNRIPSNRETATKNIYLMLISRKVMTPKIVSGLEIEEEEEQWHYATVTSLSKLFATKAHGSLPGGLWCPICTNRLDAENYAYHVQQCKSICSTEMKYVPPGTKLRFEHFASQYATWGYIVADMESILVKVDGHEAKVIELEEDLERGGQPGSVIVQEHVPVSIGVRVVSTKPSIFNFDEICPFKMLINHDPVKLMEDFIELVADYTLKIKKMVTPTDANRHSLYNHAMTRAVPPGDGTCCICGAGLGEATRCLKETPTEYGPVRFVDHFTGVYQGRAHFACNSYVKKDMAKPKVTVWFHNGGGYDFKLAIAYLSEGKFAKELHETYVLAKSSERWTRFDLVGASFKDSMSHLPNSLDKLVQRIAGSEEASLANCTGLQAEVEKYYPGKDWRLLARKGDFPYCWFDHYSKMCFVGLPPKEAFASDLGSGYEISDEDYARAQEVYNHFGCQTFGDYMRLYLLSDVCLLGDVLLQYQKFILKNYGLDPIRFESMPAVAWAAALKFSNAELDLISDPDMMLFFQRAVRGGISYAVQPEAAADNKSVRAALNGDKSGAEYPTDSYIINIDANQLYGSCMMEFLPMGGFEWVAPDLCTMEHMAAMLNEVRDNLSSQVGYMFEVDLYYPMEVHNFLSDLPPAPDFLNVTGDMLHPQQVNSILSLSIDDDVDKEYVGTRKLVPSLLPKEKYVCYGTTLALYLELGVRVTKIHRIAKFRQGNFMSSFISRNISLRQEAQAKGDQFGVDAAKLMGNSAYGKTIQDVLRQMNITLVHAGDEDEDADKKKAQLERQVSRNNWRRAVHIRGEIWAVEKARRSVTMDKPIQIGAVILEISKFVMYRFFYKVVKPYFGSRVTLLYTDTDSLMLHIKSPDAYREMALLERQHNGGQPVSVPGQGFFDWSNMDPKVDTEMEEYGNQTNRMVAYKFKNELASKYVIPYAIFVRSKLYQLMMYNRATGKLEAKSAAKGVPKSCRQNLNYSLCLNSRGEQDCLAKMIRSSKMKVYTGAYRKKALPESILSNDKRFIYESGLNEDGRSIYKSVALGHYLTFVW